MRSVRTTLLVFATGACIAGTAAAGSVPAAGADAPPSPSSDSFFQATARADVWRLGVGDTSVPIFPGGEVLDASPATAATAIDASGLSEGFASAPYPGAQLVALPTVANGATPGAPFPAYPLIATTAYPSRPSARVGDGPYQVASDSSEETSKATASLGMVTGDVSALSVMARSLVNRDGRVLTAGADSGIIGLSVGSVLHIAEVSAHAAMKGAPGEAPSRESRFSLGTVTVAGTVVGLTDHGLEPLPGTKPGSDLSGATRALADAGITLALLPSRETPTGIDSAGLAVGLTKDVPGHGRVTTTLLLGQVSATAVYNAAAAPGQAAAPILEPEVGPVGGDLPLERSTTDPSTVGASAPVDTPGRLASAGFGGDAEPAAPLGVAPPRPTPRPDSSGDRLVAAASPAPIGVVPLVGHEASPLYLGLVGAGLLVVAGSAGLSLLALRRRPVAAAGGAIPWERLSARHTPGEGT